ncbi:AAA family ATPase [Kineococcus sp. NUM-3379]
MLVTGPAGCGKSALLREIVMSADQRVDFAAHLRNWTVDRLVDAVADGLSLPPRDPGATSESSRNALIERLPNFRGRARPRALLVLDSLDESGVSAHQIATFLRRVSRFADVVVALRSGHPDLVRLLDPDSAVDLDDDHFFRADDIVDFVHHVLGAEAPDMPGDAIDVAVTSIVTAAGRNFLIAGLLALARAQSHHRGQAWARDDLPETVSGAMKLFVERLANPDRAWQLLLPVALSLGQGWPVNLWAGAVARLTGQVCTKAEIDEFRRTAAEYLLEQNLAAGERTVRIFHEALTATVLAERQQQLLWSAESMPGAGDVDQRALVMYLVEQAENMEWRHVHSYIRRFLPGHARAAGELSGLVRNPRFLSTCSPGELHLALTRMAGGTPPPAEARVHSLALPQLGDRPETNAALLALAAHYSREGGVAARLREAYPTDETGGVIWFRPTDQSNDLGHADWVTAVHVVQRGGRHLLLSGGADRTVRSWPIGSEGESRVVARSGGTVRALAHLGGHVADRLAMACDDGAVHVHRLSGVGASESVLLLGHTDWVRTVIACDVAGVEVLVSGGDDGTVRVWRGQQAEVLHVDHGWVLALAAYADADGKASLASGHADGTVALWDLEGLESVGSFHAHDGAVRALAVLERPDGIRLISAGDDGAVRLWSPGMCEGQALGSPSRRSLRCVGTFQTAHGWNVVTGGLEQEVIVHRLDDQDRVLDTRRYRGHNDWVRDAAVISSPSAEGAIIFTGSDDGSIRAWSYPPGFTESSIRPPAQTWYRTICALGDGRSRFATGGTDGFVRVWEPSRAEPEQFAVRLHDDWVRALCRVGGPGPVRLVSCGDDGRVVIWRPGEKGVDAELDVASGSLRALADVPGRSEHDLIFSVGDDGLLRLWDLRHLRSGPLQSARAGDDWLRAVCCFRHDNRVLVACGGDDAKVTVWEASDLSAGPVATFQGHTSAVRSLVAATCDGTTSLFSTGDDGRICSWAIGSGNHMSVAGHKGSGLGIVVAGGRSPVLISVSADETIRGWDMPTLSPVLNMPVMSPVFAAAEIESGRLAVVNQRGVGVFEVSRGVEGS